jgi:hypothetical protein
MKTDIQLTPVFIAMAIKCESKVMISLEVSFSEPLSLHYPLKSKIKNRLRFFGKSGPGVQTLPL